LLTILAAAYGTVLFAELLGDKSIYAIGSLTTRFRAAHVLGGMTAAFAVKMAVAVTAGRAISTISPRAVAAIGSITFLVTAVLLWRKKPADQVDSTTLEERWPRAASVSFSAIFLTEWADPGQLAAAALTTRFGHPLWVWSAATAAMMTKGALAIVAGAGLRHHVSQARLRYVALAVCVAMSILSAMITCA
jgi:Ca2+/H+ antiporter, TMEM165/GDT1 family